MRTCKSRNREWLRVTHLFKFSHCCLAVTFGLAFWLSASANFSRLNLRGVAPTEKLKLRLLTWLRSGSGVSGRAWGNLLESGSTCSITVLIKSQVSFHTHGGCRFGESSEPLRRIMTHFCFSDPFSHPRITPSPFSCGWEHLPEQSWH